MTCRDVMTANPACCVPEDSVARAAEIMRDENVGPVPVVSDHTAKRLVGIVTDRDIAVKAVAAGRDPQSTRVSELMSESLVTCRVNDDYTSALESMARHQVRRIPVVNDDGSLAGIIAQADVARHSSQEETGEVVEEISEPAGMGHGGRYEGGAASLLLGACCFTTGAALMYLLDPSRGRTRRAKLRDKATSAYSDTAHFADKVQRDLQNRAKGTVASMRSRMSHEDEISDQKLEARVRTNLGRITSHPHAIHVTAQHGRITLDGSILAQELSRVMSAARSVRGVTEVESRLHVYEEPAGVPELQGGVERRGQRSEFMQSNWSPAARLMAGAVGGGMVLYGMRSKGRVAKAAAAVGAGLLTRGVSNKEVSSWTGNRSGF